MGACRKPFTGVHGSFGCGQCLSCRIDKRRGLVGRLLCESYFHDDITFVTLTVDSEKAKKIAPDTDVYLNKLYVQRWLNRFRMRVAPTRIRYFLVGEYGIKNLRPHYHAILYGYPPCLHGGSRPLVYRSAGRQCPCDVCRPVTQTWRLGDVTLDVFNYDTAAYVAGYVVDKINEKERPGFESWRLSSDGLGAGVVPLIVGNKLVQEVGSDFLEMNHGGKTLPIDRYLRGKIKDEIAKGLSEEVRTQVENEVFAENFLQRLQKRSCEFKAIRKEALENDKLSPFEKMKYELDKNSQMYLNKVKRNKTFRKENL